MAIARNISINSETYELEPSKGQRVYVGTCSTAAATNPKVCTVETFPVDGNGKPYKGTEIVVKFTATNSSTSTTPQLNVNGTGAISIWYNNAVLASAKSAYAGYANRYLHYVYDGTYWVFMGHSVDNNSTYSNVALGQGYAVQNNSAASATITAALGSYALTVNGIVSVKFTYDVPANATLNINGKGAKAIYNKDAAITSNVIKAGDTATFIYNTYYRLISVDRWQDKQDALVSGTNLKTVNNTSLLGSGNVSVQPTLISGTNIKTVGGNSLLGSGNITLNASDVGALPSNTHIPADQVQSNWNETNTSSKAYIQNKPTIPAAQVNSDWDASSGVAQILNKPSFKTINGESIVGTGDVTVQGEQGPAGTIAIGSVSSGTSASVTNSGTASAAVLDFVLPKGAKGDKGDKGDTGASGVHVGDTVIEQSTGTSTTSLMSQKAVTDAIANANVFSQQYGVMGFDRSTQEHSTEKYRTFPFDDLKFVDVSSRVYFRNKDYGNGSEFFNITDLFQIKADSSNYLTVVGERFNVCVKLFKDGQLIHQSTASDRSDSVLHLHNHNIHFDLINKIIVFTTADRAGSVSTTYMVDMSDWDFNGLVGKQVSFGKYFSRYNTIYWLYTFVKVNEPITTTLTLNTRPYSVKTEFPMVDYYDAISREPTGLNNTGLSVTETISATHKKFSKTSEGQAYVSFFASGTNALVDGVPLIHGVKFKLLSGSPTFSSFLLSVDLYVLEDDGTLTSLWGYDFAENTEYVIISDIVIGSPTTHNATASYKSAYAMYGTGVFTCEVSEPFVIYPQYQMLCSENIVDGVFQGNIPFSADGASLVPYTPNQNISNSYVYYHLGELKVDNGNVYMWNGVAWKQISN